MILGMSVAAFTTLHVIISLVAILSGIVVVLAMIGTRTPAALTHLFLWTTLATSVTGFFFHSTAIGPPHIVGVVSLVVLAVTFFAYYVRRVSGRWRMAYVATAVLALYLNCFVLVVQGFQKVPFLNVLAPTGAEPPFFAAQAAILIIFVGLGVRATRRYHPVAS